MARRGPGQERQPAAIMSSRTKRGKRRSLSPSYLPTATVRFPGYDPRALRKTRLTSIVRPSGAPAGCQTRSMELSTSVMPGRTT